ncbi:MAG TPA: tetraacyldisaccharide 4'-kinase [Bacteroidales bacterium]|nr:tetraacyldisaccharide 4'-kinase [Bacteroidales bacterium]
MKRILVPFSFLYGAIVWIRNLLYDIKVFKSYEFKLPVISLGNITVGGTGKTPHTEYLIRLLEKQYKVAFLSRGYKRKTRDFRYATESSTVNEIGDEPWQIRHKFPHIIVAVDRDRVNGIRNIQESYAETDIILLDDAFQHRSVKPGINILLVDYNRPIFNDTLLPRGELREPVSGRDRADIFIVTKSPANMSAMDRRLFAINIDPLPHQRVYFSTIKYNTPLPVFAGARNEVDFQDKSLSVLLVTGIAKAKSILDHLRKQYTNVEHVEFADHHAFTVNDIQAIQQKYNGITEEKKIIFTTEKDAVRLRTMQNSDMNPDEWYYLPIEIEFLHDEGELFNRQIMHYINTNSRKSLLYKG